MVKIWTDSRHVWQRFRHHREGFGLTTNRHTKSACRYVPTTAKAEEEGSDVQGESSSVVDRGGSHLQEKEGAGVPGTFRQDKRLGLGQSDRRSEDEPLTTTTDECRRDRGEIVGILFGHERSNREKQRYRTFRSKSAYVLEDHVLVSVDSSSALVEIIDAGAFSPFCLNPSRSHYRDIPLHL